MSTLIFLCAAISIPQANFRGPFSRLVPRTTTLTTECYLYQGFPDYVVGPFQYADRRDQKHEDYLAKLLNHPAPYQEDIRDSAAFLAGRFYIDSKGKPRLLLSVNDAQQFWGLLYYGDKKSFTGEDKLLSQALETYFRLSFNREEALADWSKLSKKGEGRVWKNVTGLARAIVVSKSIGESWTRPFPAR
ncbi:MAG: hypothetical protein QOJ65_2373 [Fimbriimonadaceae bacterium]|nr:hypothetical protein [Fimbriimonadaceae bacterium]